MQPSIPESLEKILGGISPGYRTTFLQATQKLVREGMLGPDNLAATRVLIHMLDEATKDRRLEHLLGSLFQSLTPQNRWLFRYPQLLQSWSELAMAMGRAKTFMGIRYMALWAAGGIGKTPPQMRQALSKARDLLKTDAGLCLNFLIGYARLRCHLDAEAMDRFIDKALRLYASRPEQSYAFLQVRTKAAEDHIDRFSRKSSVVAHRQRLTAILQAISAAPLQIEVSPERVSDMGALPPLIHALTVYLPAQFDRFHNRAHNFDHLQFAVVVCAAAYTQKSFCRVHGQQGLTTSQALFREYPAEHAAILNNLFICTEVYRVLAWVIETFRGLGPILTRVLQDERAVRRERGSDLLLDILEYFSESRHGPRVIQKHRRLLAHIQELASSSASYLDVVEGLTMRKAQLLITGTETLVEPLPPLSFFPEYNHPLASGGATAPFPDQEPESRRQDPSGQPGGQGLHETMNSEEQSQDTGGGTETVGGKGQRSEKKPRVKALDNRFYYYDEWNQASADYHPRWVRLQEIVPAEVTPSKMPAGERLRNIQQIKRAFEQLKPDLMRKQKFLLEGDAIDTDLLIEHLCNRKAGLLTAENYYQKPYINRRDLAVALLLDLSGSTGSQLENGRQVIDMEKEAAFILGEGLAELGDRFGIFGFTGQGRLGAEFFCLKEFDDPWNDRTQRALFEAATGSTTRMGVAIRHTGHKMARLSAHKKLVLVITDGKPMDAEYSPHDGYAQSDVAKAVGELKQRAIDVFCISTEENKIRDLEIMFPFRRYAIIQSMTDLPKLLTRFYLKLTT